MRRSKVEGGIENENGNERSIFLLHYALQSSTYAISPGI